MWAAKRTNLGFALDEVLSAFQKDVRRGNTSSAIGFVLDAWRSGLGSYIIGRMRIILSEDIGIANPTLPQLLCPSLERVEALRDKGKKGNGKELKEAEKLLTQCTMLLCESPKSRIADMVAKVFFKYNTNLKEYMKGGDKGGG